VPVLWVSQSDWDYVVAALKRIDLATAAMGKSNNALLTKLTSMEKTMANESAQLDAILADVSGETDKLNSLVVLTSGLRDQILALTAGNPVMSAKVQAIFDAVEQNKVKVQAALDAGVVPAPGP
jgi:esterase/lipase